MESEHFALVFQILFLILMLSILKSLKFFTGIKVSLKQSTRNNNIDLCFTLKITE